MIALVADRAGALLADPDVTPMGLPDTDDDGVPMEDVVTKAVTGAVTSIPKARRKDKNVIAEAGAARCPGRHPGGLGQKAALQVMGDPTIVGLEGGIGGRSTGAAAGRPTTGRRRSVGASHAEECANDRTA
ncbi:hypothetical protein OKA06_20235 [Novosphingobium sp. MW5]|nr:hypothetical protein [Novosphingobium sp. MW5]